MLKLSKMQTIKKTCIIFALLCVSVVAAYGQDCKSYWQQAEELRSQGKYCEAKKYYEKYSKCNADADVSTEIAMCERRCQIHVTEGEEKEPASKPTIKTVEKTELINEPEHENQTTTKSPRTTTRRSTGEAASKNRLLDDSKERSFYLNLGYAFQYFDSKETDFLTLKSAYALTLNIGKTFYLHKKPVLKCLKFGIDWTFFDLNFADYSKSYKKNAVGKSYLFQIDVGMHAGVSITINPVKEFNIIPYFRYAPSFSGFYNGKLKPYTYNYTGFIVTGLSLSYKAIAIGAEWRWGKAKYKFTTEDDYGFIETHNNRWTTNAARIYISYKF